MSANVQHAAISNLIRVNWNHPAPSQPVADNAVLNEIGTPLMLLDEDCRLIQSNQAADAILRQGDGIHIHSGLLMTMAANLTTRLQSSLRQTMLSGRESVMPVARRSGRVPFVVKFNRVAGKHDVCLCTMVDTESGIAPNPAILVELYSLTHAEARLAVALSEGQTVQDVAASFNIKVSTVRSHLRTVFAKTGTCRQSDLVRLVLTLGIRLRTP